MNDRGQIELSNLPGLDNGTIICLQAGEVNSAEFDDFAALIPLARAAGASVHIDGLWARALKYKVLTQGVEQADSWTTDGHKWLNTPYDGGMNADAIYSTASHDTQKNLTLEFSRRPRGIPVWAALHILGLDGATAMIERHCMLAQQIGEGFSQAGFDDHQSGSVSGVQRGAYAESTRNITGVG